MLIGIDALGNVINRDQENIFQGSNLANEVKVVSELSSNIEMKVQFLTPRYATKEITLVSEGEVASGVNLWSGAITYAVTQYFGVVRGQIKAYNGTQIIASGSFDFEVKKGFEEELPPEPDPDVYLQIIQALATLRGELVNKVDISFDNDGISQVINNDENGLKFTTDATTLEIQSDKVVYNGKEIATQEYSDTGIANHNVSDSSHQDIRASITNQISAHNQSASAHQDIRDMITGWTENVARKDIDNNFSISQSVNGERLATEEYVDINGGKINKIKQNNVELAIINKTVDIDAYTKQQSDDRFALETDVADIESKIPNQASSSNQLADKDFVNSSISTATATFRGTYNVVTDLNLTSSATESEISTALASEITTADNNDYCFVQIPTTTSTPTEIARIDRYKFDGTDWSYEYSLNNSGFTASQWAAINSGITDTLVTKLNGIEAGAQVNTITGVKGNAESSYRIGNVEIDPDDLDDTSSTNKFVTASDKTNWNGKMDKANPTGTGSLSINRKANTTVGANSFVSGNDNTASGANSAAIGGYNTASGACSFAVGGSNALIGNTASGFASYAGGIGSTASGECSVADGYGATASGSYSQSRGNHTIAQRKSQLAFGKYNIADTTGADGTVEGSYVEIVGNGTSSSARSNARTLDWNGNEELAGNIILKGGKIGDGKNANYKLLIPDTTSWTSDKTIATTDMTPDLEVFVETENSIVPEELKQGGFDFELQENETVLYVSKPDTYELRFYKEDTAPTRIYTGDTLVDTLTTSGEQSVPITVGNDTVIKIKSDGYWKTSQRTTAQRFILGSSQGNKKLIKADFSNDKYLTRLDDGWDRDVNIKDIVIPENLIYLKFNINYIPDVYISDFENWINLDKENLAKAYTTYYLYVDNYPMISFTSDTTQNEISDYILAGNKNLEKVNITGNIEKVGKYDFCYCENLSNVIFSEGINIIDESAFRGCVNISIVILPSSLQYIGNTAFYGCNLTEIEIPENVISIGDGAFGSNNLTEVEIPKNVTHIGNRIFAQNGSLERVDVYASSSDYKIEWASASWVYNTSTNVVIHALNTLNATTARQAFGTYWNYINNTTEAQVVFDLTLGNDEGEE